MLYEVQRAFRNLGKDYQRGDLIEGTLLRYEQQMADRRIIRPASNEAQLEAATSPVVARGPVKRS